MIIPEIIDIVYDYLNNVKYAKIQFDEMKTQIPKYLVKPMLGNLYAFSEFKIHLDRLLDNKEIYVQSEIILKLLNHFAANTGIKINVETIKSYSYDYQCGNCKKSYFIKGFFNKMTCGHCNYTEQKKITTYICKYYVKLKPQITLNQLKQILM